ncbi:MAG: hypothetical protein EBZ59_08405 [Planctomycetia bacterium]|nr:hypothetical protein [Planctomycetia bacterium]
MIAAAVALAVLVGLFGEVLDGSRFLAFRDAMHFFPPLYRLVAGEWQAGRVPLWNPWLNGGQPLAAMNTAGAFYPPQVLITSLFPDGWSLSVLMIAHVALAGAAAFTIARDARASRNAALVAGLCFALSGCLLFHVYGPNTLTGSAWAAWAVRAGNRLLERLSAGHALGLSAALALAVLSGDPQSAVHAGIVIGILLAWGWRGPTAEPLPVRVRANLGRCGVLVAAALLGGLLSFVQLSLTREFMLTTTRYTDIVPASIWDVPAFLVRAAPEHRGEWYSLLVGRPPPGVGFYREVYRFGAAPWWLVECLSPTLCGPFLGRWPHARGWEGESFVATMYAGIVPLACAIVALTNPAARRRAAGWGAVLVFSYLAALGGFGAAGALRHGLARATGAADVPFYLPGDEVGGLYWLLATIVPGYSGFRYPAKWLPMFALALSQLAATGFDESSCEAVRRHRLPLVYAVIGGLSLAVTAAAVPCAGASGGFVLAGGLLAAAVAATAGTIAWLEHRGSITGGQGGLLLVGTVALDLVLAGRCFLFTSPFSALVAGGAALETLRPLRLPALAAVSDVPRLAAIDDLILLPVTDDPLERARLTGIAMRCHTPLLHGWGKVGEPGTAMESDAELFFHAPRPAGADQVFARRMFDAAAVEFFVVPRDPPPSTRLAEFDFDWSPGQRLGVDEGIAPTGPRMPAAWPPPPERTPQDAFVKYVRNESARPRARIAGRVVRIAPLATAPDPARLEALAAMAFPCPSIPSLGSTVVVESTVAADLPVRGDPPAAESCRIVVDEPRRVVVRATLESPGLVVLADTFHPDWHLRVRSNDGPPRDHEILRVNHIQRGCVLPAGRHELTYTHRSKTFERAWPVSLVAWIATLVAAAACRPPRQSRLLRGP